MTKPYRVIVVEDDLDVLEYTKTVLEKKLGCVVRTFADSGGVREAVTEFEPDIVITDIEMPGMSGLDLIKQIREAQPGTPVLVITAHVSVDYAVTALRNQANEFLTKPVDSAELITHVKRLADDYRVMREHAPKSAVVLAIGAHPDDVEVGVGGLLAAHRDVGNPVTMLVLSRGDRAGGVRTAWEQCSASAGLIGARVILEDTPEFEVRTDSAAAVIKRTIAEVNPTIIYVHSKHDRHQDHRTAFDATMIAATGVPTIVGYQGSTATVNFQPNRFVTIDGRTDMKLAMLECFTIGAAGAPDAPVPNFLQPDFALATARYWSRFGQGTYCEPLEIVRESVSVERG